MVVSVQSEKKYYVYTLAYPDGSVFYVGKGSRPGYDVVDRIKTHESMAKSGAKGERYQVIRDLNEQGLSPLAQKIFYTDEEQEALLYEAALIILMNAAGQLTNIRYGNRRVKKTPRKKMITLPLTIEKNGETYYSITEAADYIGISRPTFNRNVKPYLREYRYGALKRIYYRQVDLDQFRGIQEVDQNHNER